MTSHKVFVCAATGTVGGAVARQLRALDWEVHATSRDTNSPAAQALASIGVHVHQGSWSDHATLEAAMAGCDLLFMNLTPDLTNFASQLVDGKAILRIAKAAGVKHAVYSGAIMPSEIQRSPPIMQTTFQDKKAVAAEVRATGFQHWTILEPGAFMANLLAPKVNVLYPGAAETGVFTLAFRPDSELPMVDDDDIAAYVAAAFQNPDKFHGRELSVVSEVVTFERAIDTMCRVTGRNIRAKYLTDEEVGEAMASNPMLFVQQVLRDSSNLAAQGGVVEEAKRLGFEPTTFERFVEREKKAFGETFQKVEVYDD
ncbi:hypothetical protein N0V88_001906 [Collariella sp. IMI 366227]|nr:hypothetical protein N0V88_001906 [Collariella sp. IMI 366227]